MMEMCWLGYPLALAPVPLCLSPSSHRPETHRDPSLQGTIIHSVHKSSHCAKALVRKLERFLKPDLLLGCGSDSIFSAGTSRERAFRRDAQEPAWKQKHIRPPRFSATKK